MNSVRRQKPRLLNEVMEAIASLRETKGSTMKRIIDQVEASMKMRKKNVKHNPLPIVKALKHGVQTGLIKRKNGKYKLGLDAKDYSVYKNFQRMMHFDEGYREARGRRRRRRRSRSRRRRGRRGRRRRRAGEISDTEMSQTDSQTSVSASSQGNLNNVV